MSRILDEAWRVTARAPRPYPGSKEILGVTDDISIFGEGYSRGLDVLGAGLGMPKPAPDKAETSKGVAAGNRAIKAGNKLSKHRPKTAQKLIALGKKAVEKSKSTAAVVKNAKAEAAKRSGTAATAAAVARLTPVVRMMAPMVSTSRTPAAAVARFTVPSVSATSTISARERALTTPAYVAPTPAISRTTQVRDAAAKLAASVAQTSTSPVVRSDATKMVTALQKPVLAAPTRTMTTARSRFMGDLLGSLSDFMAPGLPPPPKQFAPIKVEAMMWWSDSMNAFGLLGEIETAVLDTVKELKAAGGHADLIKIGEGIANDCDSVISEYKDPFEVEFQDPNANFLDYVKSIETDTVAWFAQTDAALGKTTTDTPAGAPSIVSLSKMSGRWADPVVITGTNLTGVTAVDFAGVPAEFSVTSSTQIMATVPEGSATGPVNISSPAGTSSSANFSVLSFDPYTGATGGGVSDTGGGGGDGGEEEEGGGGGGGGGGGEEPSALDMAVEEAAEAEAVEVEAGIARGVSDFRETSEEPYIVDDADSGEDYSFSDDSYIVDDADSGEDYSFSDDSEDPEEESLLEEDVLGDSYNFEWLDVFMPHRILQKVMAETPKETAEFKTSYVAPQAAPAKINPVTAKRMARARQQLILLAQRQKSLQAREASDKAADKALLDTPAEAQAKEGETVMGFPMDESDDLILESFEHQITDEEPDPMRRRASMHRGASYLEEDYPPGGSSAAPQGTEEVMDDDIRGEDDDITIFGNIDDIRIFGEGYSRGLDVLGAVTPTPSSSMRSRLNSARKAGEDVARQVGAGRTGVKAAGDAAAKTAANPRAGFVLKKTAQGRPYTALVVNKSKKWDPQAAIKNAQLAGKRAVETGQKLLKTLAKKAVVPAGKGKTPIRGAAPPRPVVKGKTAARGRKLTPGQMKRLAESTIKAGKAMAPSAAKFGQYAQGYQGKIKTGINAVQRKYGPSGRPGVRVQGDGDEAVEVLGAYCDVLGAEMLPDPNKPGLMMDGSIDPTYEDAATESMADPSLDSTYGLPPAPTKPIPLEVGDYVSDPNPTGLDRTAYDSKKVPLPNGVIFYDSGLNAVPWQGVGSLTRFSKDAPASSGGGPSGFQWGGGNANIMDGWYWWWNSATGGTEYKHENAGNSLRTKDSNTGEKTNYGQGAESMPVRNKKSLDLGWGPLIGNPNDKDFKGLRYDVGGDKWFWYYDVAPDWAKQPGAIARLTQAQLEHKAALTVAKAEATETALQDMLDAKEADLELKKQAKDDVADQRRIDQEQKEQEHQSALQAVVDDRAAAQETAADTRAAEAEERRAKTEEEREVRAQEREIERETKEEERLFELAQRLDAMAPPPEEAAPDEDAPAEGYDLEEAPIDPFEATEEEVVLGHMRCSDRIRARREERR